jgi:hypothetical protein
MRYRSWLRYYPKSRKVSGSIFDQVIGIFNSTNAAYISPMGLCGLSQGQLYFVLLFHDMRLRSEQNTISNNPQPHT